MKKQKLKTLNSKKKIEH